MQNTFTDMESLDRTLNEEPQDLVQALLLVYFFPFEKVSSRICRKDKSMKRTLEINPRADLQDAGQRLLIQTVDEDSQGLEVSHLSRRTVTHCSDLFHTLTLQSREEVSKVTHPETTNTIVNCIHPFYFNILI